MKKGWVVGEAGGVRAGAGGGKSWSHNRTDSDGNRDALVPSADEVVG